MIISFLSFHFNDMSPIENLDFNHTQVQKFFEGFNKNEESRIIDFEKFFNIDNILLLNNDLLKSDNCKVFLDKFFYNIDYPLYRNKWNLKMSKNILLEKIKIGLFCKVINTIEYFLTHIKMNEQILKKCLKCFTKTIDLIKNFTFLSNFFDYYDLLLSIYSLHYITNSEEMETRKSNLYLRLKRFFKLYKGKNDTYSKYILMRISSSFYENFDENFLNFFSKNEKRYLIYLQLFDFRIFEGKMDELTFNLSSKVINDEEKVYPSIYLGASLRYLSLKKYYDQYDEEVANNKILTKSEEIIQKQIKKKYKTQSYQIFKSYFDNFKDNHKYLNYNSDNDTKKKRLDPKYLNDLIQNDVVISDDIIERCFRELKEFFFPFDNYIFIFTFLFNCIIKGNFEKNPEEKKLYIYNSIFKYLEKNSLSKKCQHCLKIPLINRIINKFFLWKINQIKGQKIEKSIKILREYNIIQNLLLKINISTSLTKKPIEYILILEFVASAFYNLGYYREAKHKYTNIINELSNLPNSNEILKKINVNTTKKLICLKKLGRKPDFIPVQQQQFLNQSGLFLDF